MFRLVTPTYRVESVLDLPVERLREFKIDSLLLDVDCTLKNYLAEDVTPEVAAWMTSLRAAGIGMCLVSNGRGLRIRNFATQVDLPYIAKALKPFPFGVRRAIEQSGFDRSKTAMVGDQLFADIMAARLAGVTSILVCPIQPEEEPWFTRLKRGPERLLLRRMDRG